MPISDAMTVDEFLALEPEEVGLRLLPMLSAWPHHEQMDTGVILSLTMAGFPATAEVKVAAHEALAWLESSVMIVIPPNHSGGIGSTRARILSRKGRRLAAESDAVASYRALALPREVLHPAIRDDVWQLYHRRRYDTAVFEAFKAVEIAVRAAGGFPNEDLGMPLMRKAFNVERGPMSDMQETAGERDALSALFAGAIGYFKNPVSHRVVGLRNPEEAVELILLANLLLRIVSARCKQKPRP